jgi:predicted CXXCH cytochrome family protein
METSLRSYLFAVVSLLVWMLASCSNGGSAGTPWSDALPLEPEGVVGKVVDRTGEVVTSGTVYFVPAADVAALPATTIAVGSTDDEPLEDTIAANGMAYQKAAVDQGGRYALENLAAGSYFITFVPADADDGHLPGGSLCRIALDSADLIGTRRNIQISSRPPPDAEYIGSGSCVECHGQVSIAKTMHRLGIWSPYETGPLQDPSLRFDDLYMAQLDKFEPGTTVWFYGYDGSRRFDKFKTRESDPGTGACAGYDPAANGGKGASTPANCVDFTVTVRKTGDDYEMLLHNVANGADPNQDTVIHVDAVYGGGVMKQRYLTRLTNAFGFYYAIMPLQFQHEGDDNFVAADRTRGVWRDYHGDWWYKPADKLFKEPAVKDSFEKNCISCHATGTQVAGSDATVWTATTIADSRWGDWDYDGDGVADEMNLGCENCHGPGSAHREAEGQGRHIVSPSLLTPERESMICGQCHSRPKGALGTDSPVNAAGKMMIAGTSRNQFLAEHATTQLDGAAGDFYADDDRHSKSHHQQYSDFIRSSMYKNGSQLTTCSTCHDPHRRDNPRQLRVAPDNNAGLCGGCHADQIDDLSGHIVEKIGVVAFIADTKVQENILCTDCHMPKTTKTGAGRPGLLLLDGTQYWQNDVTAHLFKVPDKMWSQKTGPGVDMPTGYTKTCGQLCHTAGP